MRTAAVQTASPQNDRLAKLVNENMALRAACRHARTDLEAIIPVVESGMPAGLPASGLRNTLGLIHKALAVSA